MNQPAFVPSTFLYAPNLVSIRVLPTPSFYPVNLPMAPYQTNFHNFSSYKNFDFQQMALHKSMWLYQKQLQDHYISNSVQQKTTSPPIKFYQEEIEEQQQTKVEELFCKAEAVTPTVEASSPLHLNKVTLLTATKEL